MDTEIVSAIHENDFDKWSRLAERAGLLNENIILQGIEFAALYNHAMTQGMGHLHYRDEIMSAAEGAYIIYYNNRNRNSYFDYFRGRVLKIDIRHLSNRLYDRDNGPGALARALTCNGCSRCKP